MSVISLASFPVLVAKKNTFCRKTPKLAGTVIVDPPQTRNFSEKNVNHLAGGLEERPCPPQQQLETQQHIYTHIYTTVLRFSACQKARFYFFSLFGGVGVVL